MKRQYLHTAILLLLIWCGTATKAGAADITIDLSTVTNSDTGGGAYTVTSDAIDLRGEGNTYILTQGGGTTTPTTRGISVEASCNVKLSGVNISITNGDVFFVESENTVNLTFEGDNTLRTLSSSTALANLGTLTLAAVTGDAGTLRCIAPRGNGINLKGSFTLTSGTLIAEGGEGYNGIELYSALGGVAINFSGGTVIAKGGTGINDVWDASLTIGDNLNLTAYGTTGSIGNVNSSSTLAAKTIWWSYASAPSTTAETVLVVKNNSGQDVRTLNLPAGYKSFAANLPAGETYTLWLREGTTDTQLQAADGTTAFTVGSEYTGLTAVGGTDPGTTEIAIDLSTVTTSGDGYTVAFDEITLTGEGVTYTFTQSEATATTHTIYVNASCTVKLKGVNISVTNGDAFNVAELHTFNLTFEGDNTLRTASANCALAAVGTVNLSAVNGDADTLRCIAPNGNGIVMKKSFTLTSGTVIAEGGGKYNGMQMTSTGNVAVNFAGGTVIAKGVYGIAVNSAVTVTMGDNLNLTAYGVTGSINTTPTPLATKTIRWTYASAPSTTAETVLVVKNTAGQEVRTLNLPADYTSFGCNLPATETYTLWLRNGATDTQLQAANGTTTFPVGYEYTGLTTVGGTDPGTTEVEIDLSTVATSGDGYTVASDKITLTGAGNTYTFTQSEATATTRAIRIEASCNIKLKGVNISASGNDVLYVQSEKTVNLTFEGDNTLNTATANSAIYNGGSLTLSAVNGNADILRCIAPRGTGINLKSNFTLNSGTVYAEGGESFNGIEMTFTSNATVNFSGGTLFAKGAFGINNGEINTSVTMGEGFSLTAYGTSRGINAFLSNDPLLARTIRWKYDNAPSITDATVLVVKNSTGKVVRTFNLPARNKGFAANLPAGNYTLWQRDMATKTDTRLQDADGTTAFAVGSGYEGLTLTDVTQSFAATPMVAYTTAAGEQTPIDFTDLYKNIALGLLKDAVTLHISGRWNQWQVEALRTAIANNGTPALGSNATLTTVTFDADVEMVSMQFLFKECTALTSVTLPTAENPNGVSLTSTFSGCVALKTVDLSGVTNISGMTGIFRSCTALESVKMPTARNTNPVDFGNAFVTCPALKSVDLSAFANISSMMYAFLDCSVLESVTMPTEPNATAVTFEGAFKDCPALKGTVDLSGFTNISSLMGTFYRCRLLTGVKLGGDVPASTGSTFYNVSPNCLVYVPAEWTTKPSGWNIIFLPGGTTDGDVTLTDNKLFRCPETFTIAPGSRITYTRDFGTEPSGIGGTAAGWETISLPFIPQEITGTNAAGNPVTLSPFNADGTYEGKGTAGVVPFWLRSLGAEKYTPATAIEPEKPYIISLPNNTEYDPKFNVTGTVTFSAVSTADAPLTIGVTPEMMPSAAGSQYTMHGNYATVPAAQSMYVINTEGTAFVSNGGDALPFRPYVMANSPMGAPSRFVIGEDEGGATAIEEAVLMGRDGGNGADGFRVYGGVEPGSLVVEVSAATVSTVDVVAVDGRTVRTVSLHEGVNVVNGLAAGVYVVGGQKAVVR